jgi:hypothetical protein
MTTAEPVVLIADLFPGVVLDARTHQLVEGIPARTKLHVIVSTTEIWIGWEAGTYNGTAKIGTFSIGIADLDQADLDHTGGQVGDYLIQRAGGCSCGKALKRWNPYQGRPMTQKAVPARSSTYGLPQSYRRVR